MTDLDAVAAPDDIPAVLRRAADQCLIDACELVAAWQDRGAGRPWRMVARELERCAGRIEKCLKSS